MSTQITHFEVQALFIYNAETGKLFWHNPKGKQNSTTALGRYHPDGLLISIGNKPNQKTYRVARLIWFYVHGVWPAQIIDHINRNPFDNRLNNLREASHTQNSANLSVKANNIGGLKGAFYRAKVKKWGSSIRIAGKRKWLGCFDTKEEAHAAYMQAAKETFGEFACAG